MGVMPLNSEIQFSELQDLKDTLPQIPLESVFWRPHWTPSNGTRKAELSFGARRFRVTLNSNVRIIKLMAS